MKKFHFALAVLLTLIYHGVHAQETPLQVIEKMRGTYDKASSYSMHVTLKLFAKTQDASALSVSEGEVNVSGKNYYSSMLGKTTVVNEDYQVFADDKQHIMLVSTAHHNRNRDDANSILDSTMYQGYQLKFLEQGATLDRIEITLDDPESGYSSIRLHIDPRNYTLLQVEYYYKAGSPETSTYEKATITYTNVKLNEKIPDSVFSTDTYFTQKKGELVLAPAFGTYRLIDQRDKNIPVIK